MPKFTVGDDRKQDHGNLVTYFISEGNKHEDKIEVHGDKELRDRILNYLNNKCTDCEEPDESKDEVLAHNIKWLKKILPEYIKECSQDSIVVARITERQQAKNELAGFMSWLLGKTKDGIYLTQKIIDVEEQLKTAKNQLVLYRMRNINPIFGTDKNKEL